MAAPIRVLIIDDSLVFRMKMEQVLDQFLEKK